MWMMRYVFFCLFLILGANLAFAESIITVNVNESTDALWTMEKYIHFTKESDFSEWITSGITKLKSLS